jgi:DNA (cytosine-5)-methyltransferase 1
MTQRFDKFDTLPPRLEHARTGRDSLGGKRPTVVSLFCGCGGLDLGFHEQGFDIVYAADIDPAAIAVYRRNIDNNAHVKDVSSSDFHADLRQLPAIDVVLGGFPCQGFSKAGPKRHGDERNFLYLEMKSAVATLRPRIFIAENVDGLSQNFGGSYLRAIVEDFSAVGYRVEWKVIDAVTFGVPQHRRRILFVGVREDQTNFVWPTARYALPQRNGESRLEHPTMDLFAAQSSEQGQLSPRTIRDAIADLPTIGNAPDHVVTNKWPTSYVSVFSAIGAGQKLCNVRHADSSIYTWDIPDLFGEVSESQRFILETIAKHRRHKKYGDIPNGNPIPLNEIASLMGQATVSRLDIDKLLKLGYVKEMEGGYDLKGAMFCSGLFKRPLWDAPSPTVLTNFHNPRYFLHPEANRPFSLRECARLQGFPDDFLITAGQNAVGLEDGYRLIGNAVPPPVGRSLAGAVTEFLTHLTVENRCAA